MFEFTNEYTRQRLQDLHREREAIRLAELVHTDRPRRRFVGPMLARTGDWLMAAGTRLQHRYADGAAEPASNTLAEQC